MLKSLKIKPEFRANVAAHAISFFINIIAYSITSSFLFIWIELASLCFIGYTNARSKSFFEHNTRNHFFVIIIFYLLAHLTLKNTTAYITLIFIFTYIYFILKDNGFSKTFQLWMYIQALLIGTTLINFSFQDKMLATVIGFIESQVILNFSFYIFKHKSTYEKDLSFKKLLDLPLKNWFSPKNKTVMLALRGSIAAALLYAFCISIHDLKPNWAVIVVVSSLQRDDSIASLRVIKGTIIGSILGWPISIAIFAILASNPTVCAAILWLLLIIAFVVSFEHINTPTLNKQIALTVLFLSIINCVVISLNSGSYAYVHLKIFNSIAGATMAFLILLLWNRGKLWYNSVMV